VQPEAVYTVGLVVPPREPMTPLAAALVAEAKRIGSDLGMEIRMHKESGA
jgi:hypothetical protein